MDRYSIAPLLREIGRGRDGSKPLDRAQAAELMRAILEQRVSQLQLGAALIALRMKGETAAEIAGFLDALAPTLRRVSAPGRSQARTPSPQGEGSPASAPGRPQARTPSPQGEGSPASAPGRSQAQTPGPHGEDGPITASTQPVVVIPTYNGARLLPNLVPLLALLLARDGVPVLIHGQASEPHGVRTAKTRLIGRVTTMDVLAELDGFRACSSIDEVPLRWRDGQPAYLPLEATSPPLAQLIALRRELGVRNVAHTLAKLLAPVAGPALLLSSYTHGEFGKMLAELFALTGATAITQRGTEGEAVINPQRPQPLELWRGGVLVRTLEVAPHDGAWPSVDARETALWTRAVLNGVHAIPAPLAAQIEMIQKALEGEGVA
jgi:anthranilate phosphoribosyltransferase